MGFVPLEFIIRCALFALCFFLSWTDLRQMRIPNWSLILFVSFVFICRLFLGPSWSWLAYLPFALGVLFLFTAMAWRWPEALGMGDVKLFACFAYALGVAAFIWIVTAASLFALLCAGVLLLCKRKEVPRLLPFAPFLFAAFVCWLGASAASG